MRKVTDWLLFFFMAVSLPVFADDNVIDEVVWIIGDEAIYKSEVEEQYRQMQYDGQRIDGDPYCVIPEQLAVQKLFLHQAKLDTITVPDATVFQQVEARINYLIANIGSKEKMEEYFKKPVTEIREELANVIRDQGTVQEVQRNLVKDVKTTPAEVRKFYNQLPVDSIPYIPMQVEVQIITLNPKVPQQEIDNVKARLRDFSEQVNKGERDFSTLAVLYSEDRGSAMMGGEMGFVSKSNLVPEFANVAFNLNDPKKVSKIVETEYGYHIIQLIEKRGDRINVRHILLRPHVSEKDISDALVRLDSLRVDLIDKKISFDEITQYVSQDKDTRNNKGLMVNPQTGNSKFEMGQLPQDVAKVVADLKVGEISKPFVMTDERKNKEVVAIVKLKNRIDGHKANMSDDYQTLKAIVDEKKKTLSTSRDSAETLKQIQTASESLKSSADQLTNTGKDSVFSKSQDEIYKAVDSFVTNYNKLIEGSAKSASDSITKRVDTLKNMTESNQKLLGQAGITIGKDDTLTLDKDAFAKADANTVKTLFSGSYSYASRVSSQSSFIDFAATQEAAKANTYTTKGTYSNTYASGNIFNSYF